MGVHMATFKARVNIVCAFKQAFRDVGTMQAISTVIEN